MIPNRDLEKYVKPDRETVIPVWEHMKKSLIQNGIHLKRTQGVAIWKIKWQESSKILDYSLYRIMYQECENLYCTNSKSCKRC